ncbi:hypothetical protein ABEB36_014003 [Hypothenemus hampei]|uniref:Uncharacterized protein n=1 Tax=Hypothenemus hampei TaxID=57062 RepID=A0ABD1E396_HYPHA
MNNNKSQKELNSEFLEKHNEMMITFLKEQREAKERSAERKAQQFSLILETFTNSIKQIFEIQNQLQQSEDDKPPRKKRK